MPLLIPAVHVEPDFFSSSGTGMMAGARLAGNRRRLGGNRWRLGGNRWRLEGNREHSNLSV